MLVEIVMIEKLINFHFYYLEDSTAGTPMAHSKSTSSRPLALLPLLLDLFYFGHRFSHFFSPPSGTVKLLPISPHTKHNPANATREFVQGNPRGIMNKRSDC